MSPFMWSHNALASQISRQAGNMRLSYLWLTMFCRFRDSQIPPLMWLMLTNLCRIWRCTHRWTPSFKIFQISYTNFNERSSKSRFVKNRGQISHLLNFRKHRELVEGEVSECFVKKKLLTLCLRPNFVIHLIGSRCAIWQNKGIQ